MPELDGNAARSFGLVAKRLDSAYVIRVHGEIDVATAPEVRRALGSAITIPSVRVILDLCDVGFIDSTGLQALLHAERRLRDLHREFVIACPEGQVLRAFEIANLLETFRVAATLEAALAL
jgi:anti-sigma B factor antagonist